MRPLIVDLGRDFRGGQHQALLLLQGLKERGHAPELIALRDSQLSLLAKQIGVPVHPVGPAWRRLTAALQIRTLLGEPRLNILHANEPHALTSAWLARAHRTVPVVVSRRIALPIPKGIFSQVRYRAASCVIAVSHFVKQSVIQSGITENHVTVIYDGVQIPPPIPETQRVSARDQFGISRESICIGNVAAFVPEKGHALLLEAFAKVHNRFPALTLLLRGDGPELPKLQALTRQAHPTGAVKFLPISTDIETFFAALDIFAFPSHAEPLGSALLAAMAHALPTAAIANGGVPEVIEHEKNGLLVKEIDPETFAAAVARLAANREEAARLGAAARETIRTHFSANQMVEETLRQYELLVTVTGNR